MTALLCAVSDGRAYLGADSRQSLGGGDHRDGGEKIVRVGAWLFGCVGDCAVETWLRCMPMHPDEGEPAEPYLLRLALAFHEYWKANVSTDRPSVSLIAVHGGRAFSVSYPANVYEIRDVFGDGCGGGSAHAGYTVARLLGVGVGDAIRMGIESAKVWNTSVGGAVHIWSSGPGDEQPVRVS